MSFFKTLKNKISEELKENSFTLNHLSSTQYNIFDSYQALELGCHFYIFPTSEEAEKYFEAHEQTPHVDNRKCLFLPGLDHSLYSGHLSSERILIERFMTLCEIASYSSKHNKNPLVIICTIESLSWWNPSQDFLNSNQLSLEISDIVAPHTLREKLVAMGYQNSTTTEEPGTFSNRGEIFDIFPINQSFPIRLNYFDDMIEEIFPIDTKTNQSLRDEALEKIELSVSPLHFIGADYSKSFLDSLPHFGPAQKNRFDRKKEILSKVNEGILFENYPIYLPLFFQEKVSLLDYENKKDFNFVFFSLKNIQESFQAHIEQLQLDYDFISSDSTNDLILPELSYFYDESVLDKLLERRFLNLEEFSVTTDLNDNDNLMDFSSLSLNQFLKENYTPSVGKEAFLKNFFLGLKSKFQDRGQLVFVYTHNSAKEQFKNYLDVFDMHFLMSKISFMEAPLSESFYYTTDDVLFLAESTLFVNKLRKVAKQKKVDFDLFAEQLATMKVGDYVIHSDHGVGKYLGLESLNISGTPSDYLVIEYAAQDKVYVPVYKMDLIQKHASGEVNVKLENLRTNKFKNVKNKARESAKKLAFDLLKLQAKRVSSESFAFSKPDETFIDFEMDFPYEETSDQQVAIERVLEDMQKKSPMDHLVCGDVGFGKTEVAMRAAFKAVVDNKQVAILVPTTILALQHYNTFSKRFKNFPVSIEFISRLKTAKQCSEIFKKVEEGKIDILIGTHKILSDKIKYRDLGLVVVDEEQRFGVNHKEKLKMLKASVDFLTLSATPLPRTLQLGFLGLKDISVIKTAPPRRQSIKTYLIKEDAHTIKAALDKEINRGGQVFIVHNKVQDIENFSAKIRELVPNATITVAHGQMNEKELEKKIDLFYQGKSQILIATTIIESGIDIPNANTMIVNRADRYGLSQLHQLRGRIGRSDKKAYAYFVIPNDRSLSSIAERRLKTLQTYAEMGSGFNIASSDLEIRGSGDILGAHQSGHIESVGLELYMELLKDAVRELKGEERVYNKNIEVKTPYPAYIPGSYIENSPERLKQYKRLSNIQDIDQLEHIKVEYSDMYGPLPKELEHLFSTLAIRITLSPCGVKALTVAGNAITIQFDQEILNSNQTLSGNIANFFLARPKKYKFSPDYKVLYSADSQVTIDDLISFSKMIRKEILSE